MQVIDYEIILKINLIFFIYFIKKSNLTVFKYLRIPNNFKMIKILKKYSFLLFCVIFSFNTYSQNFSDLSGVNFSDLNSSKIDLILRRASSQGYN